MTGSDPNLIEFCVCLEGPYNGAQKLGTPPRCERCGFVPNEPWVHEALLDLLVRARVLTEHTEENVLPGWRGYSGWVAPR